jgi:predicted Zn-dependent protease
MSRSASAIPASLVFAALLTFPSRTLQAEFPAHFTNLQVLAKETSKEDLLRIMRGWTEALGVRCTHCHAGPDNLDEMDFQTDSKMEKRVARQMLKMVQAINKDYIATLPVDMMERERVACYTCHHGQVVPPQSLAANLTQVAHEDGAGEALERYRTLRKDHLDDGTYDFRERTLTAVASSVAQDGKVDDALKLMEANRELFPNSAPVHALIGHLLLRKNDKEGAAASFERALKIDPANQEAKDGLARAKAQTDPH